MNTHFLWSESSFKEEQVGRKGKRREGYRGDTASLVPTFFFCSRFLRTHNYDCNLWSFTMVLEKVTVLVSCFFLILKFFIMRLAVLPVCVCLCTSFIAHIHRGKKRILNPWNQNYRQLWARHPMGAGINLGSSGRTNFIFNHRDIFLEPC